MIIIPLDSFNKRPSNHLKQRDCAIDWSLDSPHTIVRKIQSRDSQPGLLDSIHKIPLYLYGAHIQPLATPSSASPKTLLSHDKNALLLSTNDPYHALWITHLKNPANQQKPFKLPTNVTNIAVNVSPNILKWRILLPRRKSGRRYDHCSW